MNILYDEFGCFEVPECMVCTSYEDKLQGASYWVDSLKKRLYEEQFDQSEFEWDLGELCNILGIPSANKEIKITVTI